MNQAIDVVISAILFLAGLVMALVAFIDTLLASAMTYAGLPHIIQVIALIIIAVWLILLSIRVLSGVISSLVIVLAILLVVHRLAPSFEPPAHLNIGQQQAGEVHA